MNIQRVPWFGLELGAMVRHADGILRPYDGRPVAGAQWADLADVAVPDEADAIANLTAAGFDVSIVEW